MKEKEEAEENKCNNFYISDSIRRARMVQQFQNGMEWNGSEWNRTEYSWLRGWDNIVPFLFTTSFYLAFSHLFICIPLDDKYGRILLKGPHTSPTKSPDHQNCEGILYLLNFIINPIILF